MLWRDSKALIIQKKKGKYLLSSKTLNPVLRKKNVSGKYFGKTIWEEIKKSLEEEYRKYVIRSRERKPKREQKTVGWKTSNAPIKGGKKTVRFVDGVRRYKVENWKEYTKKMMTEADY